MLRRLIEKTLFNRMNTNALQCQAQSTRSTANEWTNEQIKLLSTSTLAFDSEKRETKKMWWTKYWILSTLKPWLFCAYMCMDVSSPSLPLFACCQIHFNDNYINKFRTLMNHIYRYFIEELTANIIEANEFYVLIGCQIHFALIWLGEKLLCFRNVN